MSYTVSVVYPAEADATFDLDYYLKTHMPLVQDNWGQYGLQSWKVVQFGPGLEGAKPQYSIQAILTWESEEAVSRATSSKEAGTVFGDVPNFSNKGPVWLQGSVVGSSN